MLGLAGRAGKVAAGADLVERVVGGGRAGLVLLAGDAAVKTVDRFRRLCGERGVPLAVVGEGGGETDRTALGRLIGRPPTAVVAVRDADMARAVVNALIAEGCCVEFLLGPERPDRPDRGPRAGSPHRISGSGGDPGCYDPVEWEVQQRGGEVSWESR